MSHYLLLIWLYFVKTIVNSLRQEYLHYGWEGVAKETWFYTINFWDCLNGLIRDMSNQLWVIIIIGKILKGILHRKYFRSTSQRTWGQFLPTRSCRTYGRVPRENINLRIKVTLTKVLEIPWKNKIGTAKIYVASVLFSSTTRCSDSSRCYPTYLKNCIDQGNEITLRVTWIFL